MSDDLTELRKEAMSIEQEAWKLIAAFDNEADGRDRRVIYAAYIIMMTSFIKSSETRAEAILSDFAQRVFSGIDAPKGWVG